jgi:hypothetical protein
MIDEREVFTAKRWEAFHVVRKQTGTAEREFLPFVLFVVGLPAILISPRPTCSHPMQVPS